MQFTHSFYNLIHNLDSVLKYDLKKMYHKIQSDKNVSFETLWSCLRWLACFHRKYKQSGVFQSPHQPVDSEGVSV